MKTTICAFFVVILVGCASPGSVEKARALYREGNHRESQAMLETLAVSGDIEAQFDLANIYALRNLDREHQDLAEAYWAKSCDGGFIASCTNLGQRCLYRKEYAKAESLLLKAGTKGNGLAARYLAELYGKEDWQGASESKKAYWLSRSEGK